MHIVIIPSWYGLPENSHAGIFVRDIAENYALMGHKVSVLSFHTKSEEPGMIQRTGPAGIKEFYFYFHTQDTLLNKLKFGRSVKKSFDIYVGDHGMPDLINTHALASLNWIKAIRKKYNIPVIHTEHLGSLIADKISFKLKLQTLIYYKRADHIIAVSRILFEKLNKLTDVPVSFISGMIHQDFFNEPLVRVSSDIARLVCVSDLDAGKGHELLLRAMAVLCKRDIEFHLDMAGAGPEYEFLKILTEELKLDKYVTFHGRISRPEVIKLLKKSEIYVTATKSESFGSHIAEGLAMGLYVVTTDCKSPEFYIDETNGVMVKSYDEIILADAIEIAIVEKGTYSKTSIRESIEMWASPQVVIPQIEEIFNMYVEV